MLKLYQSEWCPYSRHVREWVGDNLNNQPIIFISQSRDKAQRKELIKLSNQPYIPTLVDEETNIIIADDDDKIIEYLKDKFKV